MGEAPKGVPPRRKALGEFLRTRRASLRPADVGLPAGPRRRTEGLRREEVAQLAGLGVVWYTWLEQGRDVRPSREALERLAAALALDPAERAYLYTLGLSTGAGDLGDPTVPPAILRMLESLEWSPAFVFDRHWDVLVQNHAAARVLFDVDTVPPSERNVLRLLLLEPRLRARLIGWEEQAAIVTAQFRAFVGADLEHPRYVELVATLTRESPHFRAWWPRREIHGDRVGQKRVLHPEVGELAFEYNTLVIGTATSLRMAVYTPVGDTRAKVRALLQEVKLDDH